MKRKRLRPYNWSAKLHVWKASGEELVALPVRELNDVRALKTHLQQICGTPRFQQRLLHGSACLDDADRLVEPIDIQLVLLPLCTASKAEEAELMTAAREGKASEVEAILNRPQNPDLQLANRWEVGPLHIAARRNHVDVIQLLLEARADIDGFCGDETSLAMASAAGHVEAVHALSEAGAKLDKGRNGMTPLRLSIERGHAEVVRVLLVARANSSKVAHGETPLIQASRLGERKSLACCSRAGPT